MGGNKNQQQTRAEAVEVTNTEIEDLLVITNLLSLLARPTQGPEVNTQKSSAGLQILQVWMETVMM